MARRHIDAYCCTCNGVSLLLMRMFAGSGAEITSGHDSLLALWDTLTLLTSRKTSLRQCESELNNAWGQLKRVSMSAR